MSLRGRTSHARVLIVDDNLEMARMLRDELSDHGYDAVALASGRRALDAIGKERFDAVVTDLRMPEVDGLQVLSTSRAKAPDTPVIVMTAYSAVDSAVEALHSGAYHYITKPFRPDELLVFLERALNQSRGLVEAQQPKRAGRDCTMGGLVAQSAAMRRVLELVTRVARSSVPVLLTGETGTGKSVIARTIHAEGARATGPFVAVNCAALPETLLESELFGHVRGAFTGAQAARPGLFAEANGGTLLLDEIGDMALSMQAKLLHVLERGTVRPVGAEKEQPIDVRLIAATNRNLHELAHRGHFRDDLLYRLEVVTLEMPALRQRKDDVVALANAFLADARRRHPSSPVVRLGADAVNALVSAPWPGNVRELQHVVERLVVLGSDEEVRKEELPQSFHVADTPMFHGDVMPIRRLQRLYARWALEQLGGHKGRAAERLGVDGKTLAKWLGEVAIDGGTDD